MTNCKTIPIVYTLAAALLFLIVHAVQLLFYRRTNNFVFYNGIIFCTREYNNYSLLIGYRFVIAKKPII